MQLEAASGDLQAGSVLTKFCQSAASHLKDRPSECDGQTCVPVALIYMLRTPLMIQRALAESVFTSPLGLFPALMSHPPWGRELLKCVPSTFNKDVLCCVLFFN